MLADAAIELFLEQSYEATSVTEITRRAGVSRSSFFNYFTGKSEILWFVLDLRLAVVSEALADSGVDVLTALGMFAADDSPETLALAIVDSRTMGVEQELTTGRAERQLRLGAAIAERHVRDGADSVSAEIIGAGYAAALLSAVWRWADLGAGRHPLTDTVAASLAAARGLFEH